MIPLTPLEQELVEEHAAKLGGLTKEEQGRWLRLIEGTESDSVRVDIVRSLHAVLERDEEDKSGIGFARALRETVKTEGIGHKETLARLATLHTLARMPKDIPLNKDDAVKITGAPDHSKMLKDILLGHVRKIVPAKDICEEGIRALENVDYLSNLFKYRTHYGGNSAHKEMFENIQRAFLEGGAKGLKKLKYRSPDFKQGMEDERLRSFAEGLDDAVGGIGGAVGTVDLWPGYRDKIKDFRDHAGTEKPEESLEAAAGRAKDLRRELSEAVKGLPEVEPLVSGALKESDPDGMRKVLEELKTKKFSGKAERVRMLSIGRLAQLANVVRVDAIKEAFAVGNEIAGQLPGLEGKSFEEQRRFLEGLQQRYGREALGRHAEILAALPKQTGRDLSFLIHQVVEPPRVSGASEVSARITHDASELFTLGKFEHNCQSPGTTQSESLLGFAAHPNELTLAFHDSSGEYVGFAFAHFLQHKEEKGRYALAVERPYSDHQELKSGMNDAISEFKRKVEALAKKEGLPLEVHPKDALPRDRWMVMPSPYVHKWYDIKGASVHGGEVV